MPTTSKPDPMADETNLARLRAMSDAESERAVGEDPDTFIPDAAWIANSGKELDHKLSDLLSDPLEC